MQLEIILLGEIIRKFFRKLKLKVFSRYLELADNKLLFKLQISFEASVILATMNIFKLIFATFLVSAAVTAKILNNDIFGKGLPEFHLISYTDGEIWAVPRFFPINRQKLQEN